MIVMKLAILMAANEDFPERQLVKACKIARLMSVSLTGIASSQASIEFLPVGDSGYLATPDSMVEIAEQNLERCVAQFRSTCATEGVTQEWLGTFGYMHHEWKGLSPYFDLAITTGSLSAPELAGIGISATLQLTEDARIDRFDGRCVIAWDGSVQAGRAVRAALPLMPRFQEVDVITVDPRTRSVPTDIAGYLAANGITANVLSLASSGETPAGLIMDEARSSDLLVMGAYGFPAVLEKWFGGVTETMRTGCNTPVLFAH